MNVEFELWIISCADPSHEFSIQNATFSISKILAHVMPHARGAVPNLAAGADAPE